MSPPRFVPFAWAVGLVSLVLSVGIVLQLVHAADAETQRDCERAVAVRDDGRAMWLWVRDTYRGDDPAQMAKFIAELDRRLPPLHCVDGNPVPVD